MNLDKQVDELVKMLDAGIGNGIGHMNVQVDEQSDKTLDVQTMGCSDCSRTPLACSVPTPNIGMEDFQ